MNAPIRRKHAVGFQPLVYVTVTELEDGTFHVDPHPELDWTDSFRYMSSLDLGDDLYLENWEMLQKSLRDQLDNMLDTLAIREHYPPRNRNDEPF
jgi:predicted phosphohydrolase